MIVAKYHKGVQSTNLLITAPGGITKTVRLLWQTNVTDFDYSINGMAFNAEDNLSVFHTGQSIPYQYHYVLSNDYDPGYDFEPVPNSPFTLSPEYNMMTFVEPFDGFIAVEFAQQYYSCSERMIVTESVKCMHLPAQTARIEDEAFSNVQARYFFLPNGVTSIGDNAFPAGAYVFLNTGSLSYSDFQESHVRFIETGGQYNQEFAEQHHNYLVQGALILQE